MVVTFWGSPWRQTSKIWLHQCGSVAEALAAVANQATAATAPAVSRLSVPVQLRLAAMQKPSRPMFGPVAATVGGPANLIEAGPLYAGECIDRIGAIRPAGELVHELAGR